MTTIMEQVPEDHVTSGETINEYNGKRVCGCKNSKWGMLAAGATEMAIGTAGLMLILLSPQKRHVVMYPLEEAHNIQVFSEQWEDTIQLLIEFWLPSFAYWVLGALLLLAVVTRRASLLVSWVFISTLLLAGSCAGILALVVAGASVIGLLPLILATVMQMYFYYVISDMACLQWRTSSQKSDDKRRASLLVLWVFISTLLLAGSCAGILALVVAGASVIGLLPLILATVMQMYFYYVISDMACLQWRTSSQKSDDKVVLVDSTV